MVASRTPNLPVTEHFRTHFLLPPLPVRHGIPGRGITEFKDSRNNLPIRGRGTRLLNNRRAISLRINMNRKSTANESRHRHFASALRTQSYTPFCFSDSVPWLSAGRAAKSPPGRSLRETPAFTTIACSLSCRPRWTNITADNRYDDERIWQWEETVSRISR